MLISRDFATHAFFLAYSDTPSGRPFSSTNTRVLFLGTKFDTRVKRWPFILGGRLVGA